MGTMRSASPCTMSDGTSKLARSLRKSVVPNALMLASLPLAIVGVQLQVRLVEEPHLQVVHGDAYREYARRVGRLLPLIGRGR